MVKLYPPITALPPGVVLVAGGCVTSTTPLMVPEPPLPPPVSAPQVFVPTMPSTSSPWARWYCRTALYVLSPKMPSTSSE